MAVGEGSNGVWHGHPGGHCSTFSASLFRRKNFGSRVG